MGDIPVFNLHLVLSFFDDVEGPKMLRLFPSFDSSVADRMEQIVSYLLDISSVRKDWKWNFTYIDEEFCAQNIRINFPTPYRRSVTTDFLISLIIHPNHAIFAKELATNPNYVSIIERAVTPILLDYLDSEEKSIHILDQLTEKLQEAQFDIADMLNDEIEEVSLMFEGPRIVLQIFGWL